MNSQNYNKAAEHFSTILFLDPVDRMEVLIKWNKAQVSMKAWTDALSDADQVYFVRHSVSGRSVTEHAGYRT